MDVPFELVARDEAWATLDKIAAAAEALADG